jgi:hypothetical protein
MRVVVLVTAVLLAAGSAVGLSYVECSSGFQNNPVLDGGRTELEFADIDNDGNVDILCIGDHGSPYINTQEHGVMVWFGNGQGDWSVFQYGDFGYGGIAVGDVNGDDLWDVGYGMHHNDSGEDLGDDMLEVALGDGTGQMWTAWDDSLVPGGSVWGMFATDFGDIDNDGDLDVGSSSFGSGVGLRVFLNNGDGTWQQTFGLGDGTNSRMEFYFRDVNTDGNADIIHAAAGPAVYFGDGAGGFGPGDSGLPRSNSGLSGISPGDVDNDGGCDVALANSDGGVEVWSYDDASGVWQSVSGTLPASGDFQGTQLCDMNADGFIDVCALGGGHTKVWLGDGHGNWTEAADITTPDGTYAAFRAGADFDHNGLPDLAMVTREGTWPSDHNVAHAFKESSAAESLTIFPVFPRGREKFANGSVQFIDWWSQAPGAESTRVELELSATGRSGSWELVADSLPNAGRYQWLVPDSIVSGDCYIRYTVSGPGGSVEAMTPHAFVVGDTVLGTAEGHRPQASSLKPGANIVRGVLSLPRDMTELPANSDRVPRPVLLDAAGRKVLDLHAGPNDVSKLSPGVYFVATPSPFSSPPEGERVGVRGRQASGVTSDPLSVTKVILQR